MSEPLEILLSNDKNKYLSFISSNEIISNIITKLTTLFSSSSFKLKLFIDVSPSFPISSLFILLFNDF